MEPFYADYVKVLEEILGGFRGTLEGLPLEAMEWRPAADMNSLAVLAVHTAAATRFWIGDVALHDPLPRYREDEFIVEGVSSGQAIAGLENAVSYARVGLARLTAADLASSTGHERRGEQVTIGWALLHALEHAGEHVGHAQLMRQLWNAHQPDQP